VVYREDRLQIRVLPPGAEEAASVRFVGLDEKTQGDWRGKYGSLGRDVVGVERSLPSDVQIDWFDAGTWTWAERTDEPRALAAEGTGRIAACRYAGELVLDVEVLAKSRRVTLYYVDWDRQRAKQTFSVRNEDGTPLDQREVGKLAGGCYLTWEVRGRVQITIGHTGGPNAVVSGLFIDPAE
jgi:hypothetical protein